MVSKKYKRKNKACKNNKAKVRYHEPESEVFVLPPDILQKLGIDLEKVNSNKNKPPNDIAVPESSNLKKVYGSQNQIVAKHPQKIENSEAIGDISLMETASLMKNSVFLSPSFAQVTTNIGELELLELDNKTIPPSPISGESDSLLNNETAKCSDVHPSDKVKETQSQSSVSSNLNCPTIMTVSDSSSVEKLPTMDITVECVEVPAAEMCEKLEDVLIDDHLDEAYLSDCSNSNLETLENTNNLIPTPSNGNKAYLLDCSNRNLEPLENSIQINGNKAYFSSLNNSVLMPRNSNEASLSESSKNNMEPVENLNNSVKSPKSSKKITILSEEILTPYSADYRKIRNCEISNLLSFACKVSRGSTISPPASENHLHVNQNNFVLSVKSKLTPVHCYKSKIKKNQRNTREAEVPNDCLSDCMDISVTDIEEHLKENEEVLQEFANEIICNDSSDIINKIERSERSSEGSDVKDIINFIERDMLSVSHYRNDQLFENGNDAGIYNNSNSDISSHEILDNTMNRELNGLLTCITNSTLNTKINVFPYCEGKDTVRQSGRESDLDSKADKSIDILPIRNICRISLPQINISTSDISDTNKNKDISVKKRIAQKSENNLQDKVEEISKYLKQCLNKVKRKSVTKANDTKESYPRKSEHKDLKSNHGVEKPGGSQQTQQERSTRKKPMKTYGKATRKDVPKVTIPTSDPKNNNPEVPSTLLTNEINAFTVSDTTLHVFFCLCDDFGRLAFYDSDIPYNHIHFWEQRVSNIVPDIVFSVYNNESDYTTLNLDNCSLNLEKTQENDIPELELAKHDICWNSIESGNGICNFKELINNSEKVQQEIYSVSQDVTQVSDTAHNKCMIDNSNSEDRFTKNEDTDKHENIELIRTKIEKSLDTYCADNISNKTPESVVEQSQIEENCLPIDESYMYHARIQNEEQAEDEIVVIQIQENLESTLAEEVQNITNDISLTEQEANSSLKDTTKESNEPTHKSHRFTFEDEINHDRVPLIMTDDPGNSPERKKKKAKYDRVSLIVTDDPENTPERNKKKANYDRVPLIMTDVPGNTPERKKKKSNHNPVSLISDDPGNTLERNKKKAKKSSELIRKSRRFTFEDKIEDDPDQSPKKGKSFESGKKETRKRRESSVQMGKDEEQLGIKKSRKQKSLDNESLDSSSMSRSNVEVVVTKSGTEEKKAQCGVCFQAVNESDWFQHIGKEHSYIAWKLGDAAVDIDKEEEFETHLKEIVKQTEGLVCSKCGLTRKYVKPYLKHFNQCSGDGNVTIKLENVTLDFHDNADISASSVNECELIKCGVCNKEIQSQKWIKHIQMSHDYLAWKQGETLDLENPVAVNDHLVSILKNEGELICSKCGLRRKYIKLFLDHMKNCTSERTVTQENDDIKTMADDGAVICAVCKEEVNPKKWNAHNMKKHYNLSWVRGETPVVATSLNIIERLLKEYKNKYKELVCNVCGISRVSFMGFYAHILVCGKSEEETEKFKILCNICNKKYIFLYQNQHVTAHREQENAKERKKQAEIKKAAQMAEQDAPETPSGRRRAAEKARTVIEKYNENATAKFKCEKCSFCSDLKVEYKNHKCRTDAADSDAEPSAASESEDSYDDVDSNVSDEEKDKSSVKKYRKDIAQSPVARAKVLPFTAPKPREYIAKGGEEHYKTYLSSEGLFPEWRNMTYEAVSEQDLPSYMPPLKQSCEVRVSNAKVGGEWKTYKRFEAMKDNDATVLFVGASIRRAAWAPARSRDAAGSREESAFLAASVHRGADAPRFVANETQSHPALIQIWNFGNFKSLPKFVFGLVHDYGTVWSMDWCPSGARDAPDSASPRLGLLATACSDGMVHIYSVPYPPSTDDCEKMFYRLNPVAELRISTTSDRKLYQATAVRWCSQIGHATIFVGYSDGTTAFYDLNTESHLLRTTENGRTVFYPYYDERAHTSCVTDVSTFPCGARAGASISCAPSGVRVTSSPAVRPRRRATHHAAVTADFEPLFPHAIFTTDSSTLLASPPELDWAGAGRPRGSLGALAACARCGRCLAHAAPHLRTVRPHPAYLDSKKQYFGTLDMIPLSKKRKKPLKDDNLATIVEPTTYEEAIKKYGVELRIDKDLKPANSRQRDMYAERFPLCSPATMAFCPAPAHHDRVAIATHSGVIFVALVSNRS